MQETEYIRRYKKRKYLDVDVLTASRERVSFIFDRFERILISFSGGKDSTILLHLVMDEAIKRNRKVGVLFIDWEVQFKDVIDHVSAMFELYKDNIDQKLWIQLPLTTPNGVSVFEPEWCCWDPDKEKLWVREKEIDSINDPAQLSFYKLRETFEEFTPEIAKWYANGEPCANFIGIRCGESLNRFRTIAAISRKYMYEDKVWTSQTSENVYAIYVLYDWQTSDDWAYYAKSGKPYSIIYEKMAQSGLTISQMRIDEPFGDTQRRGLHLFSVIEPDLWAKMVTRIAGVNAGALYCKERGNVLGNNTLKLPEGHTWKSFALFLLDTLPDHTATHFKNKFAIYLNWYKTRGYPDDIPDDGSVTTKEPPSWKLICKTLLRNDYWCKTLSFAPNKTSGYQKYLELCKRRRNEWKIFPEDDPK
jgi:predicted phosphoadenosine phosphosulfate sulfurtransferase